MAKTRYVAIDANGIKHTRNSSGGYSHTVVARRDLTALLVGATSKEWAKQDGKNYDYEVEIAAGKHQHVTTGWHASYSADQVERFQASEREQNAKRIAEAVKLTSVSREQYIADQQVKRVADIMGRDFVEFVNLGWRGRLDLAQKLAAKGGYAIKDVTILSAQKD